MFTVVGYHRLDGAQRQATIFRDAGRVVALGAKN